MHRLSPVLKSRTSFVLFLGTLHTILQDFLFLSFCKDCKMGCLGPRECRPGLFFLVSVLDKQLGVFRSSFD